jgi:hypothetical protein
MFNLRTLPFALAYFVFIGMALTGNEQADARPDDPKPVAEAPEDKSLPIKDYRELGLPAQDAKWGGTEMEQASKVLSALGKKDLGQLPRYQSKQSGEVFARITSADNLAYFRKQDVPVATRMPQAITFYTSQNQILVVYLNGYLKKKTGTGELIELMGAMSRSSLMLFEVSEEFLPTIPKDDPNLKARLAGLDKMRMGLAQFIQGTLQTITEKSTYSLAEQRRLIGYAKETFPGLWSRMTAGGQLDMSKKLEEMTKDDGLKDIQAELKELQEAIKKAEKKGDKP